MGTGTFRGGGEQITGLLAQNTAGVVWRLGWCWDLLLITPF